eukprot:TRINITY_DN1984_c0_g1_i1.p1 TRINITY_DN1984_c0_g1~~TRINITY_DN1984_c0_g1_i1.p1  ORF type:complete len:142 (+),score=28.30 TRINITY_DN1984_c0_g1_i1:161-586(+)
MGQWRMNVSSVVALPPICTQFCKNGPLFNSKQWNIVKYQRPQNGVILPTRGSSFTFMAVPKDVRMVDPVEAKRLAAEQFKQLKAEEKLKKQRKAEAINAGLAVVGLLAGLAIEAETGESIITQVAGYLSALSSFLKNYIPS